ncbi:MAG TPA: hypothetical protein VLB84_07115 [Bacteroidia bacterium]|nr:hypothetical protein [Bacteroidia bacterium]
MNTNDFINSIDNKLYNRIRQSKSDAECRRYLKEHLAAITVTHCCKSDSEQLRKRPNTSITLECFTKEQKQQKDNH